MPNETSGPSLAEIGFAGKEVIGDKPETEVSGNLHRVTAQREAIRQNLSRLQTNPGGLNGEELALLNIEAKTQEAMIADAIAGVIDDLNTQGIYDQLRAPDIRYVNLHLTDEVVEILAAAKIPFEKAIVLINKVCTAGWRFRDWDSKATIRGEEGYRRDDVLINDEVDAPYYKDLPTLMQRFGDKLDALIKNPSNHNQTTAERIATWSYFTFLTIHPFADGNGRTARALTKLILNQLGQKDLPIPGIEANAYGGSAEASNALYETRQICNFSVMKHGWLAHSPDTITRNLIRNIRATPANLSGYNPFIDEDLLNIKHVLFNPTQKSKRPKGSPVKSEGVISTALQALHTTLGQQRYN